MPTHMNKLSAMTMFIDGVPVCEFESAEITWMPGEPDITGETRPQFLTAMNTQMEFSGTFSMSRRSAKWLHDRLLLGWRAKGYPRRKMIERAKRLRKKAVIF